MVVLIVIGVFILLAIAAGVRDFRKGIPQAQEKARRARMAQIVCPHCHSAGRVTTKAIKVKKGISGGKATGAILTGGVSMLGTGLSRKEGATSMSCANCGMSWTA